MLPPPPDDAYLCALASLPDATPARLAAVAHLAPPDALAAIARGRWDELEQLAALLRAARGARRPGARGASGSGRPSDPRGEAMRTDPLATWQRVAATLDPAEVWAQHRSLGVEVWSVGSPAMPAPFATDVDPPPVLFARGDAAVLDGPAAAIVGTRRCSRYGRDIAYSFGGQLARAGVAVVSGLAAGIDAAAHHGCLDAHTGAASAPGPGRPVGVVGTGLDVPYPRANRGLWESVAATGVLVSEYPLGTPPAPWRFPARNRLIVAAADVVVVVESHGAGGALITAREALARGRAVLAVPGPIHSPASVGTNALLSEGAHPCLGIDDVLCAIGRSAGEPDARVVDERASGVAGDVLDLLGWVPASLDHLALRSGLALPTLSVALTRLVAEGHVVERAGHYERVAR